MAYQIIDLTEEDFPPWAESSIFHKPPDPIGVEISIDIVDLNDSDDDVHANEQPSRKGDQTAMGPKKNTHPRKLKEVARERKRKRFLEARKTATSKKKTPCYARKAPDAFDSANIPGGCNFIIIDEDSDEAGLPNQAPAAALADGSRTDPLFAHQENLTGRNPRSAPKIGSSKSTKTTPLFRNDFFTRNYNLHLTQEAAEEMQESLFQQAAERVRQSRCFQGAPLFSQAVFDIATSYPSHFTWKDPHSCLGLPKHASMVLIKSQFRRLARIYHPDKSRSNTSAKFHAINIAYRKLVDNVE